MYDNIFDSKYLNSIAIFGGSFDPIHYGHLRAAETVREEFDIGKIVFMPTGKPPHKRFSAEDDTKHRYEMAVIATASNPHFQVSSMEIMREGVSYTVDTLKEIKKIVHKDTQIYFIVGADSLVEMEKWKSPDELFSLCSYIAIGRPGINEDDVNEQIAILKSKYNAKIHFINKAIYPISSTEIRRRIKDNRSITYFLPPEIENYIKEHGLYIGDKYENSVNPSVVIEYLHANISEKRRKHILGVAETAVKLAKTYGVDEGKAYLAGLLHDIAKEIPDDKKLKLCDKYGIDIDEIMKKRPDLTHPALGAYIAKHTFGVDDVDLLNAITYHTTGRQAMSALEKIIYVADMIEPNRSGYSGLEEMRNMAYIDLDKIIIAAIKRKIEHNKRGGKILHPASMAALEYLESQNKQ